MKKIAITGGIGSGKSAVSNIIKKEGYSVFSCDEIYAEVMHFPEFIADISGLFSSVVKNGAIDKKALSDIIFSSENERKKLNSASHPIIMRELLARMESSTGNLVFAEVPLLFEGDFERLFDEIIVVMREKDLRVESIMKRNNITKDEALARIQAQVDYDGAEMQRRMENIGAIQIYNNVSLSELRGVVVKCINTLKK